MPFGIEAAELKLLVSSAKLAPSLTRRTLSGAGLWTH